jgi:hypothetical protein
LRNQTIQFKVTPRLKLEIEEPTITGTVQLHASPKPNQHRSLKLIHKLPSPQSPSTAIQIVHTLHDRPNIQRPNKELLLATKSEESEKRKRKEEVDPNLNPND